MCRKQPGIGIGRLCEKCDGRCVVCDSYVRPKTKVRVCDECNYGSYQGRCVLCGSPGVSDAYYCTECTQTEKDVRRRQRARALRGAPFVARNHSVSPSAFRTHSTPHWTHAHARARPHARAPPLLAARWLSKDRQLRQRQDGSVLRAQKVWIQAEIVAAPGGARSKARRARRARVRIVPSLCTRRARESEVQRVLEQERSNGAYYSEISRRVVLLPQPCENLWIVERRRTTTPPPTVVNTTFY